MGTARAFARSVAMQTFLERANVYRLRAEELRTMAEGLAEPSAQVILLQIADDYDRMADKVVKIWHGHSANDELFA
jgi:hypothetical protein